MAPIGVSVIIPTFQGGRRLPRALDALAQQLPTPVVFEVLVVVDGSTDGTGNMLRRLETPYPLLVVERSNGGRAAACNSGLSFARGEIVVLLDDDMQPCPNFVEAHYLAHREKPRLGVVGAAPMEVVPVPRGARRYLAGKFNRHLEKLASPEHGITLRDFYSGNFSIRRDLLLEAGGFDEGFTEYGNEDLELSIRLRRLGIKLAYSPTAAAHQTNDKNFLKLVDDNIAKGRTAVLLARKHPEAFPDLKLGTFAQGPIALRIARDLLLTLAQLFPSFPRQLRALLGFLEQRNLLGGDRFYELALGFFYWTGARAAMRAQSKTLLVRERVQGQ
jgi:glycosyltransferase involved in cell wall biosynthesis